MRARGIGETGPLVERRDHGIDRPDPTFLASMILQPRERDRSPLQGKTSRQITASEVTMGKSHGKRGCCQKERVAGFGRAAHRQTRRRGRFTLADDPGAAGSVRLGGGAGSSLLLKLQSQTPLGLAPVLPLRNGTSASNGPAALKWIAPPQAAATSRGFTSRAMRAPSSRWALRRLQSNWSRTHQPSESPK